MKTKFYNLTAQVVKLMSSFTNYKKEQDEKFSKLVSDFKANDTETDTGIINLSVKDDP